MVKNTYFFKGRAPLLLDQANFFALNIKRLSGFNKNNDVWYGCCLFGDKINNYKGKLLERVGRKATGLKP